MSKQSSERRVDQDYPITLYRAEEGGFVAEHRDLPGCLTQGDTLDETLENLLAAKKLWIATALEHGDEIPLPSTDARFGGRVLVRMPRSLHRRLFERAESEGASLNQLIVAMLAASSGMGSVTTAPDDRYSPAGTASARVSEGRARRR